MAPSKKRLQIGTQYTSHDVHKTRPSLLLVERFRNHIIQTASPETFPGILNSQISPSEKFVKLFEFHLDGKKRQESDRAPCPMCQPNKFLSGSLVWFPDLLAIGAIGHCCADKVNLEEANRLFKQEQEQRKLEDELWNSIPSVSVAVGIIDMVRPVASEALQVFQILRKECEDIRRLLKEPIRTGKLRHSQRISNATNGLNEEDSLEDYTFVDIGEMSGAVAWINEYHPVSDLARVFRELDGLQFFQNETEALDYLASLSLDQMRETSRRLLNARRAYSRFKARLFDFVSFFDEENIQRLNDWANHPLSNQKFEMRIEGMGIGRSLVVQYAGQTSRLPLKPILWSEIPDLKL